MRILKTVILCLAFVLAVFLCSANVHSVQLHYIPDLGIPQLGEPRSLEAPLFLMVLAAVAVGLVLGGSAALFEQTRLKLELRGLKKALNRCSEQAVADESELGVQREEIARQSAEMDRLRRERDDLLAAASAEPFDLRDRDSADAATTENDYDSPASAPSNEDGDEDSDKI